jgi:hypothetical protein
MALKDLEGKRTGRPPGARTSSPVRRDILWAYKNLNKPDAKPPCPGAKMWAELARTQPGRFLACVARIEAAGQDRHRRVKNGRRSGPHKNGAAVPSFGDEESRRLKRVTLSERFLFTCMRAGERDGWVYDLPFDAYIVDRQVNESQRATDFVIHSEDFPEVAEGKPIPELQRERR